MINFLVNKIYGSSLYSVNSQAVSRAISIMSVKKTMAVLYVSASVLAQRYASKDDTAVTLLAV